MRGSYKVVDTDRHVVEPRNIWALYLETSFKKRAPKWLWDESIATAVLGKPMSSGGPEVIRSAEPSELFAAARAAGFSPQSNLDDMDREGVDVAVLLPSAGLYVVWGDHVDAALAVAICRAYNNWLADYSHHQPERLKGVAMIPLQDVPAAVREMRRAVEKLGMVGVLVRPNPVLKRQLESPEYWPIYAEAQRLGIPIWVHGSPGSILPEIGVKDITGLEWPQGVQRFEGSFARNAISYPLEIMGAMISLAGEEPMMEFPGLKVVFSGAGSGWLPWWVDRMDDEYWVKGRDAVTRMNPGVYVRRQGFACARANERLLPDVAEEFAENLVWGSEYPHPGLTDFPNELESLVQNPRLSEAVKKKILWETPSRLLKIS